MLLILSLCGCGEDAVLKSAAVETPATTLITTSTPAEESAPIPTMDEEAIERDEVNQRIHDFINFEGDFSEEALIKSRKVFTDWDGKPMKFGRYDDQMKVAGWLFDSYEKDGENWLVVGFDGKDGERFVTVLRFDTELYTSHGAGFGLATMELDGMAANAKKISSNNTEGSEFNTGAKITELLESIENGPIKIGMQPGSFPEGPNGVKFNRETDLINEIFVELADNGVTKMDSNHSWYPDSITKGTKIVRIDNIEDAEKISSDDAPEFGDVIYVEY